MRKSEELLRATVERALRYLDGLNDRGVAPSPEALANLRRLDEPFPDEPGDAGAVISLLDEVGSPATMATAGGRYFGFVVGAALPATVAANWLAGAWNQNAGLAVISPIAAKLEDVVMGWLLDVLRLPPACGVGFVTNATQANLSGLAAARHALLARQGWNVEAQGLFGAPPIRVVVGEEVHVSVLKALTLLGLGRERVARVPADGQGRMRADALPPLDANTIVCLQAGNVNTGAFDPAAEIIPQARAARAWVHVDGAFGLWAAASPSHAHLLNGFADRRLLGHRRAQVAQRALRQRHRHFTRPAAPARGHGRQRPISRAPRYARTPALHARHVAAGAERRTLDGAALIGTSGVGRDDREDLPPRDAFRGRASLRRF